MNESSQLASFWEHLEELRRVLIKIAWVVLIGTVVAFAFSESILSFLTSPLKSTYSSQEKKLETYEVKTYRLINNGSKATTVSLPDHGSLKSSSQTKIVENTIILSPNEFVEWEQTQTLQNLLLLGPIEGFSTSLKISLWLGIVGTSPLWCYFIFQFIAPALHAKEKYLALPFFILSTLFITSGLCFAYLLTIPLANNYFFSFNEKLGLNLWSFSHYIDYTLLLMLSHAVTFELFVIVLLLVHYGLLTVQMMKSKRKHSIVAAFILAALITPPDVPSQFMVAIPMIIFYEIALFYAIYRSYTGLLHTQVMS